MTDTQPITAFSPAKINLYLSVTNPRDDGYHDLVSLFAPINFGDTLTFTPADKTTLSSNSPNLSTDNSNLVLQALDAFRQKYPFKQNFSIHIDKKVPLGSGLGGGSSNATTTLKVLNTFFNNPLGPSDLMELALQIGSDCPPFLFDSMSLQTSRWDPVIPVNFPAWEALRSQRILLLVPKLSISTKAAFSQLKSLPDPFIPKEKALSDIEERCLFNSFEPVISNTHSPINHILTILRNNFNLTCLLSGTGSACFAIMQDVDGGLVAEEIKKILGNDIFIIETSLL